jgi:aspartyl/glutamyl-tRNA(Asn/Gln) amidotransferase C subunit
MAEIIPAKLQALAKLSRIALTDTEMKSLGKQIGEVLTYAARVKELAERGTAHVATHSTANRLRVDTIIPTDPAPILEQAPAQEAAFFVVPAIIEQ